MKLHFYIYSVSLEKSNIQSNTKNSNNNIDIVHSDIVAKIEQFKEKCTDQTRSEIEILQEIDRKINENRKKQNEELLQIQMMINNIKQPIQQNAIFTSQSNEVIEYKYGDQIIKALKIQIENKNLHQILSLFETNKNLNHPNILKANGLFFGDEKLPSTILLEFHQINLEEAIKKKKLTKVQLVHSIYQIAEGMKYLHSKSISHIHLNPSNIFISNDEIVKLCIFDLPISKNLIEPTEQQNLNDKGFDIYSFGIITYFILSGGEFPSSNNSISFSDITEKLISACFQSANEVSFDTIVDVLEKEICNFLSLSQQEKNELVQFIGKYKALIPQ